jgi:hypothetical protein
MCVLGAESGGGRQRRDALAARGTGKHDRREHDRRKTLAELGIGRIMGLEVLVSFAGREIRELSWNPSNSERASYV